MTWRKFRSTVVWCKSKAPAAQLNARSSGFTVFVPSPTGTLSLEQATTWSQLPTAVYNRSVTMLRVALLVALCVLTFFVGLGRPAIMDSDEAFYAEAAREMVEGGGWVTPLYNGEFRFEKPVLYYWLAAIAYLVAGVGESAARFPSALAGLVLVLTTFACARRWHGEPTALLAGAITATSFGYIAVARQALPDLLLACFVTLGTWAALVALVECGAEVRSSKRWWLLGSGAALACAFLTKGPIGIALPVMVVGPLALFRVWSSRSTPLFRQQLSRLVADVAFLAAVFLLFAVPWFAAMTTVHGVDYLDRFFIGENLQRFATDRYNDPRPIWYYIPIVIAGLLPWSPFMLLWCRPLLRLGRHMRRIQPVNLWLAVWAAVPLLFFSISIGKQPRYILPVLPPLAIFLALSIARHLWFVGSSASPRRDCQTTAASVLSGTLLCVLGALVYRAQSLLPDGSSVALLLGVFSLMGSGVVVIFVGIVRRQFVPVALVSAAVVSALSVQYVVLSRAGPEPVEVLAALIREAEPAKMPYGRYRVFVRNLVFYTGRPHVELSSTAQVASFLRSSEPVLGVIDEDDLDEIRASGVPVYELGRVSYLNTGNLNLGTLLRPNPEDDLRTVILVTNQPSTSGAHLTGGRSDAT